MCLALRHEMLSLHLRQRGQERPQPPWTSTLALPGLSSNWRRTRPAPQRAGQTPRRLGPLPGGRRVAHARTVSGREPQLRHELGMRGRGRQGAGAGAGQCGRMGGSRRTVDLCGEKTKRVSYGGLLILAPSKSAGGRWGIVAPRRPSVWMRNFLTPRRSSSATTSGIPTDSSSKRSSISAAKPTPSP